MEKTSKKKKTVIIAVSVVLLACLCVGIGVGAASCNPNFYSTEQHIARISARAGEVHRHGTVWVVCRISAL